MFDYPQFDNTLVAYIQHGFDQAYHYIDYMYRRYDPYASYLTKTHSYISYLLSQGDPRTKNWPLLDFRVMLFFTLGYLWLVASLWLIMKYVPPMRRWEEGKGFNVKYFAVLHNIVLTALSAYMFVEILHQAIAQHYSLWGNAVDRSSNGLGMARVLWVFYASKILEFIDTILMCLRKSFRQITFLHVYHHASIYVIWWIVAYYIPGGEPYFSAMLNSFIHIWMYGYYLWSAYAGKPAEGEKATWKHPAYYRQYITTGQMIQFALNLTQATYLVTSHNHRFPRWAGWLLFYYMLTMLALFGNFAYHQYGAGRRKKAAARAAKANSNGKKQQ